MQLDVAHTSVKNWRSQTCLSKNVLEQNQNKSPQKTLGQTVISTDMKQEKMELSGHNSMSTNTYAECRAQQILSFEIFKLGLSYIKL